MGHSYGAISTDGKNWERINLPAQVGGRAITYGDNTFIATGNGSATCLYSTNNGSSWASVNAPASLYYTIYGNGVWVGYGYPTAKGAYSTNNGRSWTAFSFPKSCHWVHGAYGNGRFVVTVFNSKEIAYSSNGVSWTMATVAPDWGGSLGVAFGDNSFYLIDPSSNRIARSTDGATWTVESSLPAYTPARMVMGYGDETFIGLGYNNRTIGLTTAGTREEIIWNDCWQRFDTTPVGASATFTLGDLPRN